MKNWKKLLACLLVGLMALTVFTACDASVGAPMGPKRLGRRKRKGAVQTVQRDLRWGAERKSLQHCKLGRQHLGVLLHQRQ